MSWSAARRHGLSRDLRSRDSRRRWSAGQTRIRGGWSGGGRSSPWEGASSNTEWAALVGSRIGSAAAGEGPAGTIWTTHIAASGQSGQPVPFSSGQHVMSPDIDAISVNPEPADTFAAAGVTSGATASPTIKSTASREAMSRRKIMRYRDTVGRRPKGGLGHICDNTRTTARRLLWLKSPESSGDRS